MDNKPILSCSKLAVQADGHEIKTLEGLQEEALEFVGFIADQGADQCGFCNPGFVMNTIALLRENQDPTDDEIRALPERFPERSERILLNPLPLRFFPFP